MPVIIGEKRETVTMAVTEHELGIALITVVWERCGKPDTGDIPWTTDGDVTSIGFNSDGRMSRDPDIAALVNAANILISGEVLVTNVDDPGNAGGGRNLT